MENLFTPDCIRTYSGKYINVFNPDTEQICIEDIAHALANLCRFGGHTQEFYSVAQHSVMCSVCTLEKYSFQALMHDASEAYLLDIPTPIKRQIPGYEEAEEKLMHIIASKFGFEWPMHPLVKGIDKKTLEHEWQYHVINSNPTTAWSSELAEKEFLAAFKKLKDI